MTSGEGTGNGAEPARAPHPARSQRTRRLAVPIPHPLFFALSPVVGLVDGNRYHIDPGQAVVPALVICAVLVTAQLALGRLLRDGRRGAVATSLLVFLFFYAPKLALGSWTGALGVALTTVVAIAVIRGPGDLKLATRVLNVSATVLLALYLGGFLYARATTHLPQLRAEVQRAIPLDPPAAPPNLYHIILDGYGREDVLEEIYGIERPLARFLRERGFFVAARSHTSYPQTAAAVATALNFAPVHDLLEGIEPGTQSRLPLKRAIGHNRLVHSLHDVGYEIVEIPSDFSFVEIADADRRLAPALHLTEFDHGLLMVSGISNLSLLAGKELGSLSSALHRRHLLYTLEALPRAAGVGPTYVFAHLLAPHPPFVFRADGSPAASHRPYILADGDHWTARQRRYGDDYVTGYREQILWLDEELRLALEEILERDPGAAILLHSDHGPGSHLHWEDAGASDLRERMAILFAVRWAGGDYSSLYPTITPANGVRILLNHLFGAELPLIEDRVWFNTWERPYEFVDITAELDVTAKPDAMAEVGGAVRESGADDGAR
jgi:hypothetical protein